MFDRKTIAWIITACLIACATITPQHADAANIRSGEPGWLPVVVATGSLAEKIEATPIESRPYRPLHFYGNTVRRMHYRGNPFPRMDEVIALPGMIFSR